MKTRTVGSSLIFSLLLAGSLNAQNYVLEWQSPEGLRLKDWVTSEESVWENDRFDMESDGPEIIAMSLWDTSPAYVNVYDGLTRELRWSYTYPIDISADLIGFYDFDGDGFKEALIHFTGWGPPDIVGFWIVNLQTSEVELTLGDTTGGEIYFNAFPIDLDLDGNPELIVNHRIGSVDNIEIWGDGTSVGISGSSPAYSPQTYTLSQNYPNPFNPATKIEYAVQQSGHVIIRVYNLRGEIVRTIVDEQLSMGEYVAVWDGKNETGISVASGQYFYQLSVGDFVTSKKLLLLK